MKQKNGVPLDKKLETLPEQEKVDLLQNLMNANWEKDPENCLTYGEQALSISQDRNWKEKSIDLLLFMGELHLQLHQHQDAEGYFQQALELGEHGKDDEGIRRAKRNLEFLEALQKVEAINHQLHEAQKAIHDRESELVTTRQKMETLETHDPLTGLSNQRSFIEKLTMERARSARNGKPFVLAAAEIDQYTMLERRHGETFAELLLAQVAERLKPILRNIDIISRWNGNQFFFLLTETPPENGKIAAERILKSISDAPFQIDGQEIAITFSIGITPVHEKVKEQDSIQYAQQATREARKKGGNRTVELGAI